jgi:hypothetical protein
MAVYVHIYVCVPLCVLLLRVYYLQCCYLRAPDWQAMSWLLLLNDMYVSVWPQLCVHFRPEFRLLSVRVSVLQQLPNDV